MLLGCSRGAVVTALDCRIVKSEFELQSPIYDHKYSYPPSYGLNSTTTVLFKERFWHKITNEGWYIMFKYWPPCHCTKNEYMCYNQTSDISTLDGTTLKLVDKFTYLGSSVSSTEKDIDTRLTKTWTAIDRLSIIWKSDLTDKMKRSFFQAAVVSILLYGYTTWTLTERLKKKLDGNYTRMLRPILNKS